MPSYSGLTVASGTTIAKSWADDVRDSVINVFATSAARTSAIPAPIEGMVTYQKDTDTIEVYNGSAWVVLSTHAAWIDFSASFTITATTTNPTKGTSTYVAKYTQTGKTVHFYFKITIAGGFAQGTGTYRFLLPVTAATSSGPGLGPAWVNDSGTALLVGATHFVDSTHVEIYLANATGGALGSGGPGTLWAVTDVIEGSITYEAA
jgi:hypothetical protein